MPDYKSMYFHLAGKVADVIELLIRAQQEGEESTMQSDKIGVTFLPESTETPDEE